MKKEGFDLKVIDEWDATSLQHSVIRGHGEVAVTYLATLFKKIRLHTHENIGWGKVRLPQDDLHSAAWWFTLPSSATVAAGDVEGTLAALGGLEIAGICGVILGGAAHRIPVVVDGFMIIAEEL